MTMPELLVAMSVGLGVLLAAADCRTARAIASSA